MPKPSVALCRPKPMTRARARLSSSAAADCPIARPSEKLWSPIPVAMKTASQLEGRHPDDVLLRLVLGDRRCAGTEHRLRAPPPEPAVVQREGHQTDCEAGGQEYRQPEKSSVVPGRQRFLHRLDRGREHIPQEEDQDPGSHGAQERLRRGADRLHAPTGRPRKMVRPATAPRKTSTPSHVRETLQSAQASQRGSAGMDTEADLPIGVHRRGRVRREAPPRLRSVRGRAKEPPTPVPTSSVSGRAWPHAFRSSARGYGMCHIRSLEVPPMRSSATYTETFPAWVRPRGSMSSVCPEPGCTTLTMGGTCVAHDAPVTVTFERGRPSSRWRRRTLIASPFRG